MPEKCFADFILAFDNCIFLLHPKRLQHGTKYEATAMQEFAAKVHCKINVF